MRLSAGPHRWLAPALPPLLLLSTALALGAAGHRAVQAAAEAAGPALQWSLRVSDAPFVQVLQQLASNPWNLRVLAVCPADERRRWTFDVAHQPLEAFLAGLGSALDAECLRRGPYLVVRVEPAPLPLNSTRQSVAREARCLATILRALTPSQQAAVDSGLAFPWVGMGGPQRDAVMALMGGLGGTSRSRIETLARESPERIGVAVLYYPSLGFRTAGGRDQPPFALVIRVPAAPWLAPPVITPTNAATATPPAPPSMAPPVRSPVVQSHSLGELVATIRRRSGRELYVDWRYGDTTVLVQTLDGEISDLVPALAAGAGLDVRLVDGVEILAPPSQQRPPGAVWWPDQVPAMRLADRVLATQRKSVTGRDAAWPLAWPAVGERLEWRPADLTDAQRGALRQMGQRPAFQRHDAPWDLAEVERMLFTGNLALDVSYFRPRGADGGWECYGGATFVY